MRVHTAWKPPNKPPNYAKIIIHPGVWLHWGNNLKMDRGWEPILRSFLTLTGSKLTLRSKLLDPCGWLARKFHLGCILISKWSEKSIHYFSNFNHFEVTRRVIVRWVDFEYNLRIFNKTFAGRKNMHHSLRIHFFKNPRSKVIESTT